MQGKEVAAKRAGDRKKYFQAADRAAAQTAHAAAEGTQKAVAAALAKQSAALAKAKRDAVASARLAKASISEAATDKRLLAESEARVASSYAWPNVVYQKDLAPPQQVIGQSAETPAQMP